MPNTVRDAIAILESRGIKLAALVIDTIISSSGVVSPPRGLPEPGSQYRS